MMKWSELQKLYPLFWMWLTAWLKNKGATAIQVRGFLNSEYVKVRFNIALEEQELTDNMLFELLEEAGIRVCINFNAEEAEAKWRYVIHKKGLSNIWTQIHSSGYLFTKRKFASCNGLTHAFKLVDESLVKQNSVEQY